MLDIHPTKWEWPNGWLLPLTVLPHVCESQLVHGVTFSSKNKFRICWPAAIGSTLGKSCQALLEGQAKPWLWHIPSGIPWPWARYWPALILTFAYLSKVALNGTYLLGFLSASRALMSVKMLKQCLTLGKYRLSEQFLVCSNCYPGVC